MSEKRDIFSELVKEKLNDFEVPYNDSHWSEMNEQLDQIQPQSGGSSTGSVLTKYAIVTGIAAAIVVGYFLLNPAEKIEDLTVDQAEIEKQISTESASGLSNMNELDNETDTRTNEEKDVISTQADDIAEIPSTESLKEKEDRFESYSEGQIKEDAKEVVEKEVANLKSAVPSARLDNMTLKTNIEIETGAIHCQGEAVQFKVDHVAEEAQYYWNFGDKGLTSRKMNPEHIFKRPGTFTVTLLVSKGEKDSYKEISTVEIKPAPVAEIKWNDKDITLFDPYQEFYAESDQQCSYLWVFNETEKIDGENAEFLIREKRAYDVKLIASLESGCKSEFHKSYQSDKGLTMVVEDAFTPINNDGLNDEFIPNELKSSNVEFTMIVKDQNGFEVFVTHDGNNAWNGRMNNTGNMLPSGLYYWIVQFKDIKGISHEQKGKVLIK